MVIVKIIGGIGNQMFQYSFSMAFNYLGKNAKLDLSELDSYLKKCNRVSIFNVFDLPFDKASIEEVKELGCYTFFDRLRKKIKCFSKNSYIKEVEEGEFNPIFWEKDNCYFDGYWQSYKYFDFFRERLLGLFKFPEIDSDSSVFKRKISSCNNPVSLHVRLGDYLNDNCISMYGNICTKEYYRNSIKYILERNKDCNFFVFSNEPDKAMLLLKEFYDCDFTFVNCNSERNGWIDMYLMSLCKYNIIANSSFSWWAAWLNQHDDKIVVAPKQWLNTMRMPDICPPEWIRL